MFIGPPRLDDLPYDSRICNHQVIERLILEGFLPYRLTRLAALVSERLKLVYAKKYRPTIPEWRVLATLGQVNGLTAKQIGDHAAMHKTEVSQAVIKLEARRWPKRSTNEADRREEVVSLTASGMQAYAGIVPEMQAFVAQLDVRLGAKRMALVEDGMVALEVCLLAERAPLGRTVPASDRAGRATRRPGKFPSIDSD